MIPILIPTGPFGTPPKWYVVLCLLLLPLCVYGVHKALGCIVSCGTVDYLMHVVLGLVAAMLWPLSLCVGLLAYGLYLLS